MPQLLGGQAGVLAANATGGNEKLLCAVRLAGARFDFETLFLAGDFFETAMGSPAHPSVSGGFGEAGDDCGGIIGYREHSPIGLRF